MTEHNNNSFNNKHTIIMHIIFSAITIVISLLITIPVTRWLEKKSKLICDVSVNYHLYQIYNRGTKTASNLNIEIEFEKSVEINEIGVESPRKSELTVSMIKNNICNIKVVNLNPYIETHPLVKKEKLIITYPNMINKIRHVSLTSSDGAGDFNFNNADYPTDEGEEID